jgi:High potential iron-sulfur protein
MSDESLLNKPMSRRAVFASALAGIAAVPVMSLKSAYAQSLPQVSADDPQAKALGYLADATKVDAKVRTTYKTGQDCASCLQLQGKAGDAYRPCNLFPGKVVSAKGWCMAWVQKP